MPLTALPESPCEVSSLQSIRTIFDAWTGTVAAIVVGGLERMVSPRLVRLVEDDKGGVTLEAGKPENVPTILRSGTGSFPPPIWRR